MTSKHNESYYKSKLVKEARIFGDYARRIEDQFTVGQPDLLYKLKGDFTYNRAFLIEAKMVENGKFHPSPRQLHELELWDKVGGATALLGFDNELYYMHPMDNSVSIEDCVVSDPGESFPLFFRRYLTELSEKYL